MELRDLRGLTASAGVSSVVAYDITGALPGTHLGIPSPSVTVVVDLRDGLDLSGPGLSGVTRFRVCLGGLHSTPYVIHHDGTQVGVQIGLSPAGVRRLFGLPVAELSDRAIDLDEVNPTLAGELAGRIADAVPGDRAEAAASTLMGWVDDPGTASGRWAPQPDAAAAWDHIVATGGRCTVAELTERSGWSARYLTTRFVTEYGIGPKHAARLVRFDRAMGALRAGVTIDAAAADAGYADQAHLTREFSEFASMSPARYLAREEFAPA
ncbi:AraC family transcriptional regulator [Gordonia sp. TBRC 11910]|uniref:AraC family transcriptional regulator n=1 Tax=Gordonia asplenii TaxID=2725283 RepID=A0A848KQ23_9ACTN|nr:helix-turn-helix domain-containing protein [Gordonia asplenii]NMO00332.1 AraC family transcriptional regulator [Gordonia asplenii]